MSTKAGRRCEEIEYREYLESGEAEYYEGFYELLDEENLPKNLRKWLNEFEEVDGRIKKLRTSKKRGIWINVRDVQELISDLKTAIRVADNNAKTIITEKMVSE